MQFNNLYTTEFLSELNLILTQEDFGNKLYDLLTPIKNIMQKENDLFTYSLARYCGANSRLAFMCEWYLLTNKLILDNSRLVAENQKHFTKKVHPKYKNISNLKSLIEDNIQSTFLPLQLSFLSLKAKEFIDEQILKYPFLVKYLNSEFLSQFTTSELQLHKNLYIDNLSLNQCIDLQGSRSSYLYICFPCIVSLTYSFNQSDNVINPKGIKWNLVEDIFKHIAAIHQMKNDTVFTRLVYEASLDKDQQVNWLEMEESVKTTLSSQNEAAKEVIDMLRERIYEKLKQDIQNLVFPDKYKVMMQDLADWSFDKKSDSPVFSLN